MGDVKCTKVQSFGGLYHFKPSQVKILEGNLWEGGRKVGRNSIQQRVLYFLYILKLYVSGEVQRFKIFLMLSQKFANIGSFLQLSVRFH